MEAHMCDLHTKIMETQDICATFTKRKVGHSTYKKRQKIWQSTQPKGNA